MTGAGLDTIGASQQTREHQRDVHIRLGACMFFVAIPAIIGVNIYVSLGLHWGVIIAVAALLGVVTGVLAYKRGVKISERVQAADRADRKRAREAQLAEFLSTKENG